MIEMKNSDLKKKKKIVISDFRCPCYVFVGQELRTSKGPTKHPTEQNEMAKTSM
jgi:hypothetical protein